MKPFRVRVGSRGDEKLRSSRRVLPLNREGGRVVWNFVLFVRGDRAMLACHEGWTPWAGGTTEQGVHNFARQMRCVWQIGITLGDSSLTGFQDCSEGQNSSRLPKGSRQRVQRERMIFIRHSVFVFVFVLDGIQDASASFSPTPQRCAENYLARTSEETIAELQV